MNKLAALALLLLTSCVLHRPMDERVVPLASDGELVAEYRWISRDEAMDPMYLDKVRALRGKLLDELAARWQVDRYAVHRVVHGQLARGVPTRAVESAWGKPQNIEQRDGKAIWHYRPMAGDPPRWVEFENGIVTDYHDF